MCDTTARICCSQTGLQWLLSIGEYNDQKKYSQPYNRRQQDGPSRGSYANHMDSLDLPKGGQGPPAPGNNNDSKLTLKQNFGFIRGTSLVIGSVIGRCIKLSRVFVSFFADICNKYSFVKRKKTPHTAVC